MRRPKTAETGLAGWHRVYNANYSTCCKLLAKSAHSTSNTDRSPPHLHTIMYLFLPVLLDEDLDEGEAAVFLWLLVLHAEELEVEAEVHAVLKKSLQHDSPCVIVFLLVCLCR